MCPFFCFYHYCLCTTEYSYIWDVDIIIMKKQTNKNSCSHPVCEKFYLISFFNCVLSDGDLDWWMLLTYVHTPIPILMLIFTPTGKEVHAQRYTEPTDHLSQDSHCEDCEMQLKLVCGHGVGVTVSFFSSCVFCRLAGTAELLIATMSDPFPITHSHWIVNSISAWWGLCSSACDF